MSIPTPDGSIVSGRLYTAPHDTTPRPGVLVLHGYLANGRFMELPWAQDLVDLGVVPLFLDRRGHGRSAGSWWPSAPGEVSLANLYPDVRAALGSLRQRPALVDPDRVALLGHSDGGTGALITASADWRVAATVSLSASVAPWEYVNDVAPQNLLLLYGASDAFILHDTDQMLIASATRGYLRDPGQRGAMGDGSARRLARIRGYGHVDVLYSAEARLQALDWLAESFGLPPPRSLAPLRWHWLVAGVVAVLALLIGWDGPHVRTAQRASPARRAWRIFCASVVWVAGLALAATFGPRLDFVPAQEGRIVVGALVAISAAMGAFALLAWRASGRRWSLPAPSLLLRGVWLGLLAQAAFEILLTPVYETPLDTPRLLLFAGILAFAVPAFAATAASATWMAGDSAHAVPRVGGEMWFGLLTAVAAPLLFVRMSVLPIEMLAAALMTAGAVRSGRRAAVAAVAGALVFARCGSLVCAFY